ncbi:MAG: aminopeptidase P family protein [Elusimicrobia bacterium]|nr:aminopeptidase P family protein [Elusimicrobiota bacterium]
MNIYEKRVKDIQKILKVEKLDAMVVTRPFELGFLTGFHLEGYMLLISRLDARAYLPKMLLEHFRSKVDFVKAFAPDSIMDEVISTINSCKLRKTAFEPETETYPRGVFWRKKGLIERKGLTAALRKIKEGAEIEAVRKSCAIASRAFKIMKPRIKPGRTEISICLEIEDIMQSFGAKGPSFNIIIGSGPNSALPHHETSARTVKNNEPVLVDFGCLCDFYCSDITRAFFIGRPPAEYLKIYSIVKKAQEKAVARVRSGVRAKDIDKTARDCISDAGYGQYFIHGTGHGIGLEIHEAPSLNSKSEDILKEGMTVTVEPGIYLPGKFGVRIEDSVLVKKTGCEILT